MLMTRRRRGRPRKVRHRVPASGGARVKTADKYLDAFRAGGDDKDRIRNVRAVLPPEAYPIGEEKSSTPTERLYECPHTQECLGAANALGWRRLSCSSCPLYHQHATNHNRNWLRAQLVGACLSRRSG